LYLIMVREAKPLTSIMAVPTPKRGRLVLEVQDPEAIANLGEQLSLANQPVDGLMGANHRKSTRSKATKKSTGNKSAAKSRSVASQAKQQNLGEPTRSVPRSSAADVAEMADANVSAAQMRDRMEQMAAVMAQMQQRLSDLQATADQPPATSPTAASPTAENPPEISPTLSGTGRSRPGRPQNPRLPDWCDPELRPHYTLQESARAYDALEALHQHRKLQTAEMAELVQAKAVAAQLRPSANRPVNHPVNRLVNHPVNLPVDRSVDQRTTRRVRRRTQPLRRFRLNGLQLLNWAKSRLDVPNDPSAKIVDLALWVIVAIGLRLVVKSMIYLFPALVVPLNLLMALPAIVAAYMAFCVPNGRSDVIYRLLLLTLGLFLGSRF
jgi:hypothetical protein